MESVYNGTGLQLTVSGASHAPYIEMRLEGFPAGVRINIEELRHFLKRRSPADKAYATARKEEDIPEIIGGLNDGVSDGSPVIIRFANIDIRRSDYDAMRNIPRPGHADYTAVCKYGPGYDSSGGGHLSGRMTVALCAAGGLCKQYLAQKNITAAAHIFSVGGIKDTPFDPVNVSAAELRKLENEELSVNDKDAGDKMLKAIAAAAAAGDSLGGIIECAVTGTPVGLGEPIFDSVESVISHLAFSVPAVKGMEFGLGFGAAGVYGSQNNDDFITDGQTIKTATNNHGGILGGITSGMPIIFRAAIKPTPSIAAEQRSVDTAKMCSCAISVSGRHDACIVPRAVPCIEACAAIALTELAVRNENESFGSLSSLRRQIDRTDDMIAALFVRRMQTVKNIAAVKEQTKTPLRDFNRESAVKKRITAGAPAEYRRYAAELFDELFRLSRDYQVNIKGDNGK